MVWGFGGPHKKDFSRLDLFYGSPMHESYHPSPLQSLSFKIGCEHGDW